MQSDVDQLLADLLSSDDDEGLVSTGVPEDP